MKNETIMARDEILAVIQRVSTVLTYETELSRQDYNFLVDELDQAQALLARCRRQAEAELPLEGVPF